MRQRLARLLSTAAAALAPDRKAAAPAPTLTPAGWANRTRTRRAPTDWDLLAELKNTAYSCAKLNAAVCASYKPRLYVKVGSHRERPKCLTRRLDVVRVKAIQAVETEPVEEVTAHPLLSVLHAPNPWMNGHGLLEHTTLYCETHGRCYWQIDRDALDAVVGFWPLPTQLVRPVRKPGSKNAVDWYEYEDQKYSPDEILAFRYPDPRDPYSGGMSPLRGCIEAAWSQSGYYGFRNAVWDNQAEPGVILTPKEAIMPGERERLEVDWKQRFGRGGVGGPLVSDSSFDVAKINNDPGAIAALAESIVTKEDIANAYDVPFSLVSGDANESNLNASRSQHAEYGIKPRLKRRDEAMNRWLVPLFDPSGRLFVLSDDPSPETVDQTAKREEQDLQKGVRTINEVRAVRGLGPVAWGDTPWLPLDWAPSDFVRRVDYARQTGRNNDPDRFADRAAQRDGKPTGGTS